MNEFTEKFGGWPATLTALVNGVDLSQDHATAVMGQILGGLASPAQIAGLLVGLQAKGETVEEMTGLVEGMFEAALPLQVPENAIDIVGTGGSSHRRSHALNVSTMACFVAAGAGAVVCKHGNRKASSTSGSFDFLEALGIEIDLTPDQLANCIQTTGLGFAYAKTYHPAMRFAGPVRIELGVPTVFNLLGPLANPARPRRQVLGVSSPERAEEMAAVLQAVGSTNAWVVAGHGGIDELSTSGPSLVCHVTASGIRTETLRPADFGIAEVELAEVAGGTASDNVAIFERVLGGESGPHRDIIVVNAAAGLVVAGLAEDLGEGLHLARTSIDSGQAAEKVVTLRELTRPSATQ